MKRDVAEERCLPNNVRVKRERSFPNYDCVHSLFEKQAFETPDRVAVVCGSLTLTYEQLNRRSNQVAHHLLALGVEPETLVGISIPRSAELIVNILGILKAGCAYLPLDPDYPADRLATMIADAKMPVLLTESSLVQRFPVNGPKVICIDDNPAPNENSENPNLATRADNLVYVMFTSGSTGRPKGVMVEHRSIVRLVNGTDYADFGADNVFLHFAPITFDASTFEIWGALLNGARLAIMPDGPSSLTDLGTAIRDHGVTTLWLTAGLFHLMVDERIDDLKPLRQLVAGGDVLSVTHVQKVLSDLDCDLINGYGPTENTTFTCTYKVPRNVELGRSIPIGKPIAHTQVIVLDKDLKPVINGEAGELYIGGDGLARGYLNSDEMTTERFVANPFAEISSSRLYRSGDLVRSRPDGNIEFLGRADNQVKIRGFRIELEEIETALTRQTGVREAVAVAREISAADKQLIAFVVPDQHNAPDHCGLRKHLEETLPEHMVPSFIVSIDALPLTTNGKVDRAALIEKIDAKTNGGSLKSTAGTPTERTITEILEEILGTRSVSTNDNFFDLGASSLQLARFHSRLQKIFDPALRIVSLFQNPTISTLAGMFGNGSRPTRSSSAHERASRQRDAYARQRQMRAGGSRP
jgi:amino acid adenylation domain-containing protein